MHHQNVMRDIHEGHRRQITQQHIGPIGQQCFIGGVRVGHQQQRVAIRRCLGHLIRANGAAGTGTIFHNHWLAQSLLQGFRQKPRRDIGGTANAKGHDDANGPRWPSLRGCWPPGQKRRPQNQACSA